MSETNDVNDAIKHFPRLRARTLRFGCGAPRATADSEDVPAEEKARRERAREGGTGIVGYSADDDGNRIVFTINGRLFLTEIAWNDETGAPEPHTRELAGEWLDEDPEMYTPVLNPRIAPDGEHVLYTTGSYLMLIDIGGELGNRITAVYGVSVEDEDGNPAENTWTRDQVLEVAVAADGAALGATRVLEEHANEQWIDLVHGTPAYTPDDRLVCSLNDMATDTNRLTVDGRPFTPAGWNVRTVLAVTDEDVLAVVQRAPEIATEVPRAWAGSGAASDAESLFGGHDARSFDVVSMGYDGSVAPITTEPGQWTASRGARGMVVSGRDMRSARARMRHIVTRRAVGGVTDAVIAANTSDAANTTGITAADITSTAAEPGFTPNVTFTRLGEHRLYTAIIAPSPSSPIRSKPSTPFPRPSPGSTPMGAGPAFPHRTSTRCV